MLARRAAWLGLVAALLPSAVRAQEEASLDPTAPGLPPVRGGWEPPPVDAPPEATWEAATRGATRLHGAIGRIGDGDYAGALGELLPVAAGRGEPAHRQEARHYAGVALARAGLPLLGGRWLARALEGEDAGLADETRRLLGELERAHPGAARLLDVPGDPWLPPPMQERLDLARATDLVRGGARGEAAAVLEGLAASDTLGVRARVVGAVAGAAWERSDAALDEAVAADGIPEETRDAARVAAARLAYGRSDLARALDLYRAVRPPSRWFPEAAVEAAWTLIRLDRPAEALTGLFLLADGTHGRPPPGACVAAALLLLEACEPERAEALLEAGDVRLVEDLALLKAALARGGDGVLPVLEGPPRQPRLAALLLGPDDDWLRDLVGQLGRERERLEDRETSPLARSQAARGLLDELETAREALGRSVAVGLLRRAEQAREATLRWLRAVLGLRHALLEVRKEGVRVRLREGGDLKRAARPAPAWSFSGARWVDRELRGSPPEHGRCRVREGGGSPQR